MVRSPAARSISGMGPAGQPKIIELQASRCLFDLPPTPEFSVAGMKCVRVDFPGGLPAKQRMSIVYHRGEKDLP